MVTRVTSESYQRLTIIGSWFPFWEKNCGKQAVIREIDFDRGSKTPDNRFARIKRN
jgi:hypothetical protein